MSGKPRSNLRGWLKGLTLAALIAAAMGGLAYGVGSFIWKDDPLADIYRQLAALCACLPSFLLALPRCSATTRAWWAGVTWTRRVSLWLLLITALFFGLSLVRCSVAMGQVEVRLKAGVVFVSAWDEAPAGLTVTIGPPRITEWTLPPGLRGQASILRGWGIEIDGPEVLDPPWRDGATIRWGPGSSSFHSTISFWLIGIIVLGPWWKPSLVWLLGGRVRGYRPLRSWNYRIALVVLLGCVVFHWVCWQGLTLFYGRSCLVALDEGRACWVHDPQETEWMWPPEWELDGYGGPHPAWFHQVWRGPNARSVSVPMWIPTIACLLWLILAVRPRHRFRRRWENGLCLHCGYDLRGLKERCTECGQPIEPERLAVLAGQGERLGTDQQGGDNEPVLPGGEEEP